MTTRRAAILFALALAGCAGQPSHQREHAREWHPAVNMLIKYAGKDGTVTHAGMEAGLRADFAAADYKHKGCLDEDEARAVNAQRFAADQSAASPLVDFKQQGCIDFDEFAATPRSLFDQLDVDGKGVLTQKELHPAQRPVKMPMHDGSPDLL